MTTFDDLKAELLKRDDVRAEYDALAEEFEIAEALIRSRVEARQRPSTVSGKVLRRE